MVCSARPARCGPFAAGLVGSGGPAASDVLAALFIGSVVGLAGVLTYLAVAGVPAAIAGTAAAAAGALAGLIAAPVAYLVMMTIIMVTYLDRCDAPEGLLGCAMGQISRIEAHGSHSFAEDLFPFTMMHDRIDLVTQSRHWGAIEREEAFVFCSFTGERTSEILRCYFFNPEICAAGAGAMIGGGVLGGVGIVAGIAAAAAIGCATIFLCVLAVLLAVLIVVAAVLLGAVIGSHIGRAVGEDSGPDRWLTPAGNFVAPGDIVHIDGNMVQRGFDGNANVLWFVKQAGWHDRILIALSHCELDELPPMCPADLI